MKVEDLVKLKGDPHEVLGVITKTVPDICTKRAIYYVSWVCDMCDDNWFERFEVEEVCR